MITIDNYEDYNLKEIELYAKNDIKNYLISEYKNKIDEIFLHYQYSNKYEYSINRAIEIVSMEILNNTSNSLFPGSIVHYYESVKESKAMKEYTDLYSGSIIHKGRVYLNYKAFMIDETLNNSYVTQNMHFELYTDFPLPANIQEFESLYEQIELSYDNSDNLYNFFTNNKGNIRIRKLK